jgi:hypothetical protein
MYERAYGRASSGLIFTCDKKNTAIYEFVDLTQLFKSTLNMGLLVRPYFRLKSFQQLTGGPYNDRCKCIAEPYYYIATQMPYSLRLQISGHLALNFVHKRVYSYLLNAL